MFKKILFATTATEACEYAARVAFEVARRDDAELIVLHVHGIPTRAYSQLVTDATSGEEVELDEEFLAKGKELIEKLYAEQLEKAPGTKIEIVTGFPHRAVLKKAREEDVDLIIMGASAGDDNAIYRKGIPGSTLQRVAKAAKCPVLTVARPHASFYGGFSSIVFGTDFSRASDSAFKFALNTAKEMDCELNIFHALDISAIHAGKVLSQEEIEGRIREARQKIQDRYVSKLEGFRNYSVEVWEGIPYVEIVKFAREKMVDLIVMAHHTREPDPEQAMIGSTMQQVILRATCPVASVNKPDKV